MNHTCLYSPATERHRTLPPVLILCPAEGRRPSWPEQVQVEMLFVVGTVVSDIAIFVLKRDVKLQLTCCRNWLRRRTSGSRRGCRRSRGPGARCPSRTTRCACCCATSSTTPTSWTRRRPTNTSCHSTRAWWRVSSRHSRYSVTSTKTTRSVPVDYLTFHIP